MKRTLTFVFVLISFAAIAQFNPLQTQYMNNPMTINPANAGEIGYMSATLSARKQWLGFNGAPETFVFTIHSPVKNLHHNIGLIAAQDNLAVIHRSEVSLSYAYRIITPRVSFAAGIAPGAELFRNNWSEIVTNAQGDAAFSANDQYTRFTIGYGVSMNSEHFFFGISNRTVMGEPGGISDQPIQVFTGVRFGDVQKARFTISTLGRVMTKGYHQFDVNANCMLRDRIGFGVGYRHKDAMVAMANVRVNDQCSVGYSYDFSTSNLRSYSSGSHEILLRYDFGYTVQRANPRFR